MRYGGATTACHDPSTRLSWDGIHPTEEASKVIAGALLRDPIAPSDPRLKLPKLTLPAPNIEAACFGMVEGGIAAVKTFSGQPNNFFATVVTSIHYHALVDT
ncbi:hypothetical protein ZWY2020_050683 [Hordeum vulgare]|nr:hypothetical protein ZWY2020_050683 [Hordeum vulgare]